MSSASLTAKYRPQRFSDVAGQQAIKRILSRACAEDRIAPAYLFSGTRGVGKTTLARVLAKALNCERAPTAEPCNECAQCRQITAGVSPDVVEIDAATHGGVDEARRLKEDIGYAPLQSRYKVFIIDEAHMLSKAAFNALLKTLEEPPGRVTFVLATTEPHKILPTIISRCQHYIFKRLALSDLEAHLTGLLTREGLEFEPQAVNIIARRGAGSVRDSMSLLGQVLALGGARLTEEDVREVLGLAGQDVFLALMQAFLDQDCLAVTTLLRQVLDRGLDIGFFLRELASSWRNMFILSQAGDKALDSMEISAEEGQRWLEWAAKFDARHIHACWQMTLEGQRRVMTSLEPALALELLLLNLAYLPRLISLDPHAQGCASGGQAPPRPVQGHGAGGQGGYGGSGQGGYGGSGGGGYGPGGQRPGAPDAGSGRPGPTGGEYPRRTDPVRPEASAGADEPGGAPAGQRPNISVAGLFGARTSDGQGGASPAPYGQGQAGGSSSAPYGQGQAEGDPSHPAPAFSAAPQPAPHVAEPAGRYGQASGGAPAPSDRSGQAQRGAPEFPDGGHDSRAGEAPALSEPGLPRPSGSRDWKGFQHYLRDAAKRQAFSTVGLGLLKGEIAEGPQGTRVVLICNGEVHQRQFEGNPEMMTFLRERARDYFGPQAGIEFAGRQAVRPKTPEELREDLAREPLYQEAVETLRGQLLYVKPRTS